MYQPPDRKKFLLILFGSLGLLFLAILILVFRITSRGDFVDIVSVLVPMGAVMLGMQWAFAGGLAPEQGYLKGWQRVAVVLVSVVFLSLISMVWVLYASMQWSLFPMTLPKLSEVFFVVTAILVVLVTGILVTYLTRYMGRYALTRLMFWLIMVGAACNLGVLFLADITHEYVQSQYSDFDKPYHRSEIWQTLEMMGVATGFTLSYAVIWAIAPAAYLITYARANRMAKEQARMEEE